jgi:4-carboxymuconolactone decarboxylase
MPEDPYSHLTDVGERSFERIMSGVPIAQVPPGSALDVAHKVVFGDIWNRPELTVRERRLITLTIIGMTGAEWPMQAHVRAALHSGDLTPDEMRGFVTHFVFYGGFPLGATLHKAVEAQIAEFEGDGSPAEAT